jgi:hypothetical protein
MEELIKSIIFKLFPEMQQQMHLVQYAKVVKIPTPVAEGELSTAFEPRYAVDIQMLDANHQPYGPIHPAVPLPVHTASHGRGMFGFPQPGTLVAVQYAYGDPERPMICNVYPLDQHLPAVGENETLLQHSAATFLRSNSEESWDLRARNKVRIGSADVDLVAEVQRLAALLRDHKHPGSALPTNAAQIGDVANKVNSLKTG